mmetsp:Transcript_109004/g.316848  ORF Transcript_109004/g.316848 Transcript_109004/m.316848 type:complete len:156 (-) Transcript_109004:118-585(-)
MASHGQPAGRRGSSLRAISDGTQWITLSQVAENDDESKEAWIKEFVDIESGDIFRCETEKDPQLEMAPRWKWLGKAPGDSVPKEERSRKTFRRSVWASEAPTEASVPNNSTNPSESAAIEKPVALSQLTVASSSSCVSSAQPTTPPASYASGAMG